ncbi:MAG: Stp1/IreP family PP2C-type Ser/Thr phosphatase [Bacteroidetes bacterium]|nr:MAG: Stp1/IreP family PP2C-type Ser/Thr phosphatase [Bacteroidota bacterium]
MPTQNFRFGNHTDIGKVRTQNEDYMGFFENENGSFFVVCDGMGGHAGGSVASQTAVQTIKDFFSQGHFIDVKQALYQAITQANLKIYEKSLNDRALYGMGTTCVVLAIKDDKVYYAHVGDSRLYMYMNGELIRLTQDHSVVQNLVAQGIITEDEAETHPRRNELMRAVGTSSFVDVEVCKDTYIPKKGDTFLLCSDGLCGLLSDAGIKEILEKPIDLQRKCLQLVETANALGGYDNITVQIVEITKTANFKVPIEDEFVPASVGKTAIKGKIDAQAIEEIPEKRIKRHQQIDTIINMDTNSDNFDFAPYLSKIFIGLLICVGVYVLYEKTLGKYQIFGSTGDIKGDSVKAIGLQNQFYAYIYNSSPALQNVKKGYETVKEEINQLKQLKEELLKRKTEFETIRNSLTEEKITEMAKRYGSKVEWILKANKVEKTSDLVGRDSLIVPKQRPAGVE